MFLYHIQTPRPPIGSFGTLRISLMAWKEFSRFLQDEHSHPSFVFYTGQPITRDNLQARKPTFNPSVLKTNSNQRWAIGHVFFRLFLLGSCKWEEKNVFKTGLWLSQMPYLYYSPWMITLWNYKVKDRCLKVKHRANTTPLNLLLN